MQPADLVIFTEEIHNGKLQFLCSANWEVKAENQDEGYKKQPVSEEMQQLVLNC